MSIESTPIRLAPHRSQRSADGQWLVVKPDGESIAVPSGFTPYMALAEQGRSIADMAAWARTQAMGGARFRNLARFINFLHDHGLLAERAVGDLAEALRPDYEWRESIAFAEIHSLELLKRRGGDESPYALKLLWITMLIACATGILLRIPLHFAGEAWQGEMTNAWPLIIAFFIAFAIGKSARAVVQFFNIRLLTGSRSTLSLKWETLAFSLASDDASSASGSMIYVFASFLALFALLAPSLLRLHLPLPIETAAFMMFFNLLVVLSELSPFRRGSLSECLRAYYVYLDRQDEQDETELAEKRIQLIHSVARLLWVAALGLFLCFPGVSFIRTVLRDLLPHSASDWLSLTMLALLLAWVIFSFIDDIANDFSGDFGGDGRLTARRLWRRKLKAEESIAAREDELEKLPFLRQLDAQTRALLLANAGVGVIKAGDLACRQGDFDRSLFIVLSGRLAVGKRTASGRRKIVVLLGPGAVFGEIAFFFGDRRQADVVATEQSRVLVIRHDRRIADLERGKSEELQLRVWFLQALMTSGIFRDLPAEALDALLFAGTKRVYKAGEKIISEGERGDACYFIVQGQASVTQNFKLINRLKAGAAFGEVSLLRPDLLRTATVSADTEIITVRLDGEKFWALLSAHLPLAVYLEELAESRLLADRQREENAGV